MNQHNDIVGEAAVEMLIGMVHNGERGIPSSPRATLIGSTWVDGTTVRSRGYDWCSVSISARLQEQAASVLPRQIP